MSRRERGLMRTTIRAAFFTVNLMVAGCAAGPEPPPFRAVADVKQLMQAMIDPAADALWDKSGYVITAAGMQQRLPRNDDEWTAARNDAITLTEAANLLMMPPRAKDG